MLLLRLGMLGALTLLGAAHASAQEKESRPPAEKAQPAFDLDEFIRKYDKNKNGFIDNDEMPAEFRGVAFTDLDTNKDGKLSRDELLKLVNTLPAKPEAVQPAKLRGQSLTVFMRFVLEIAMSDEPSRECARSAACRGLRQ